MPTVFLRRRKMKFELPVSFFVYPRHRKREFELLFSFFARHWKIEFELRFSFFVLFVFYYIISRQLPITQTLALFGLVLLPPFTITNLGMKWLFRSHYKVKKACHDQYLPKTKDEKRKGQLEFCCPIVSGGDSTNYGCPKLWKYEKRK